jgi:hypothetical protein
MAQLRSLGYYPDLDPPAFNQPGGLVEAGFMVTLTPPSSGDRGEVYYTTDGSDPRQPVSGAIAPTAGRYTGPFELTATTPIRVRRWVNGSWSALNEATFKVVEQKSKVVISEIMYNPLEGSDYEFIELTNVGDGDLKLAGMYFSDGISYTFPPGTPPLAPGQYLVLGRNQTAFAAGYPRVALGGVYQGKLSNQGEKITLRDAAGNIVAAFAYDDENGWPLSPDGLGDSLTLANPNSDPSEPRNWRASLYLNGSPGGPEAEP